MFLVPSVLGLQFRNRWRYICCLLARRFLLVRWFVGSWFCLFASGLRFGALGVQFGLFVLSRWFGACCFILFDSALQGWGPATVVGAFLFSFFLDYYCFLGALYGVQLLHPRVDMQLCYFPCLSRPISVIL
jgi:hypothetical protein